MRNEPRLAPTRGRIWEKEASKRGFLAGDGDSVGDELISNQNFLEDLPRGVVQELTLEPLLTPEEEIDLTNKIANARKAKAHLANRQLGNKDRSQLFSIIQSGIEAQERLVLANTRLIISVAARYTGYNFSLLDLVQEGVIGLIRAIGKFDPRRGFRFSTYATWWVRQAISRFIENEARTIRIPAHMNTRVRKVLQTADELAQKLGRDPSDSEIGRELNMNSHAVRDAKWVSLPTISLELPKDEDGDRVLLDTLEDDETRSTEDVVAQTLFIEQVFQAFRDLSDRKVNILMLRFGLVDGREHTLQQLGEQYGLTRERVREIQDSALNKLRYYLNGMHKVLR